MITSQGYRPSNALKTLEKLTGITESEQKKIMKEIKENHTKLNSCSYHNFIIEIPGRSSFDMKYRCTNCDGVVSSSEKKWYELGMLHERRKHENL